MKKGLKIAAITVGVIIILMFLLPFAFQGKIAGIVKTEGNKMLNAQFDFKNLNISLFRNFPQASVTLEDFWLKGTGEFANDTLVQAGNQITYLQDEWNPFPGQCQYLRNNGCGCRPCQ